MVAREVLFVENGVAPDDQEGYGAVLFEEFSKGVLFVTDLDPGGRHLGFGHGIVERIRGSGQWPRRELPMVARIGEVVDDEPPGRATREQGGEEQK